MKPIVITLILITGILGASFTTKLIQQKKPWPVPDNYKNMKNPVASNAESIAAGKALWGQHCKSCHGTKGLGDGPKAAQLKTEPGDFAKPETQSQTDGSLFYKTSEGRDDMPSFKKKIPDTEERWSLVNYMRTLKK
ncbi:MAG: cytochrome c [Chitinophagaceae bacterium]|nr:MAG: cytochrome c [Chitinophagaceae bacterium]